jgi:Mg-chelatase subunit ChlD
MHWELFLVVDVSGSMEASVIYAALTASIFHALPALAVSFLTFSDKVADLSERVDDPLGLLLEVKVAGGTNIARGLRAARDRIKVPSRSIVVLISDFEEGGPMGILLAEVRALAESGATLLGLAALDDKGQPRYSTSAAGQLVGAGMPVAALTPLELARWVAEKVR